MKIINSTDQLLAFPGNWANFVLVGKNSELNFKSKQKIQLAIEDVIIIFFSILLFFLVNKILTAV